MTSSCLLALNHYNYTKKNKFSIQNLAIIVDGMPYKDIFASKISGLLFLVFSFPKCWFRNKIAFKDQYHHEIREKI